MTPTDAFQVVNVLPLPIWLCWILAPRSGLSHTLARTTWRWAMLATIHLLVLVVAASQHGLDPRAFASLGGVMGAFRGEWLALAGWVHYLCFDLFVGRWIMNDAPDAGYWLSPILLLTLMVGPVGLLCYLAVRGPLGWDR